VVNWVPVHVESGRKEEMLVKVALGTTANQYFLLGRAQVDTEGMLFIQECIRILIPYQPFKFICRHQVVANGQHISISTYIVGGRIGKHISPIFSVFLLLK